MALPHDLYGTLVYHFVLLHCLNGCYWLSQNVTKWPMFVKSDFLINFSSQTLTPIECGYGISIGTIFDPVALP